MHMPCYDMQWRVLAAPLVVCRANTRGEDGGLCVCVCVCVSRDKHMFTHGI
jgi:hypothetical protein